MTQSSRDLLVAAAFTVLAAVFLVEGRDLAFESRGIPGPGLFPLLLSAGILGFSALLALLALRLRRRDARTPSTVEPGAAALTPTALADESGLAAGAEDDEPRSLQRAMGLWLLILVVCISLPVIGFLPAMLLLTGVLMLAMERRHDLTSLVSAVAVPVAFYFLFATLLDVRLPTGPFG